MSEQEEEYVQTFIDGLSDPNNNSTAIGDYAEAVGNSAVVFSAGGQNVLEILGESGKVVLFGVDVPMSDPNLAAEFERALRAFIIGTRKTHELHGRLKLLAHPDVRKAIQNIGAV